MDILIYLLLFGGVGFAAYDSQGVGPVVPPPVEKAAPPAERPPGPPPQAEAEPPADRPVATPAPDDSGAAGTPDDAGAAPAPSEPAFQAEDQTPSGRMTTATEVRPILSATKPQWLALREFDNRDLLYFSNLLAWRCGLLEIRYAIDGGPLEVLPMAPCHLDEAVPNALKSEDALAYVSLPKGSVAKVRVEVLYDDLSTDGAEYERAQIVAN